MKNPMPTLRNIFAEIGGAAEAEQLLTLFENGDVRVERIVSHAHSSPPDFWYDQSEDEWVIVMRGNATLEFEGAELVEMRTGDYLTIPAHVRHRVARTDDETIWLAVHASRSTHL